MSLPAVRPAGRPSRAILLPRCCVWGRRSRMAGTEWTAARPACRVLRQRRHRTVASFARVKSSREFILPESSKGWRGSYQKLRVRGSIDYPLAGVAVALEDARRASRRRADGDYSRESCAAPGERCGCGLDRSRSWRGVGGARLANWLREQQSRSRLPRLRPSIGGRWSRSSPSARCWMPRLTR